MRRTRTTHANGRKHVGAGGKIIAAIFTLTAVLGLGALAAGPAMAATSSTNTSLGPPSTTPPVANYTLNCTVPIIGTLPMQVSIFAEADGSVHAGTMVDLHSFRAQVSIPSTLVNLALFFHVKSLSGDISTLDFQATNTTNGTVNAVTTPIPFGPVTLVENQPATFTVPSTPATVGPWTADSSGTIVYTPGSVDLKVILPISCTPVSPQPLAETVIR